MTLPKLAIPFYDTTIPSTGEKIKYRPFLAKEEKILLMALKGKDVDEITNATKQIINNCIVIENFNIDSLQLYDLEWLLLQIRIKSQGDELSLRFRGYEDTDCEECKKERVITVDLNNAMIEKNDDHTDTIMIDEKAGVGMKMRCPSVSLLGTFEKLKQSDNIDDIFKVIWKCVDSVFDKSEMHSAKDASEKEYMEFLESLTEKQMAKIEKFFDTMPKLVLNISFKCNKCDRVTTDKIEGLQSFFP